MKHLHMLMAALTILLFLYQSFILLNPKPSKLSKNMPKSIKVFQHLCYTLLIISGAILLMQLLSVNVPVQWAYAKIILLLAAISATVKATRPTANPPQQKMGIFIAMLAYVGIVILAFVKPDNLF